MKGDAQILQSNRNFRIRNNCEAHKFVDSVKTKM